MTHEPNWLLDWYWNETTGNNASHLICDYLKGRCKLRIAGDLHHYMRHSIVPSEKPVHVQHLLVNGCGGAFLHPTHVFKNFSKFHGAAYDSKATYPSFDDSSKVKQKFSFSFYIYFVKRISTFPSLYNCHFASMLSLVVLQSFLNIMLFLWNCIVWFTWLSVFR